VRSITRGPGCRLVLRVDRRCEIGNTLGEIAQCRDQLGVGGDELAGGGAKLLGAAEYFSASLNLPTSIAEPFLSIKHPPLPDQLIAEIGPKLAVTIGLALNRRKGSKKR